MTHKIHRRWLTEMLNKCANMTYWWEGVLLCWPISLMAPKNGCNQEIIIIFKKQGRKVFFLVYFLEPQSHQRHKKCTEAVTHPSTNIAHCCLTSVKRQALITLCHKIYNTVLNKNFLCLVLHNFQGGIYIVTLLDWYTLLFSFSIISLFEVIVIIYIYGKIVILIFFYFITENEEHIYVLCFHVFFWNLLFI